MISAISQNRLPGTELKAWALYATATGTVLKSFNMASVVKNAVGTHTITFINAMSDANYIVDVQNDYTTNTTLKINIALSSVTTMGFGLVVQLNGNPSDLGANGTLLISVFG